MFNNLGHSGSSVFVKSLKLTCFLALQHYSLQRRQWTFAYWCCINTVYITSNTATFQNPFGSKLGERGNYFKTTRSFENLGYAFWDCFRFSEDIHHGYVIFKNLIHTSDKISYD